MLRHPARRGRHIKKITTNEQDKSESTNHGGNRVFSSAEKFTAAESAEVPAAVEVIADTEKPG